MSIENILAFDFINPFLDEIGLNNNSHKHSKKILSNKEEEFHAVKIVRIAIKTFAMFVVSLCVLSFPLVALSAPVSIAFFGALLLSGVTGFLAYEHEKTVSEKVFNVVANFF